MPAFLSPPLPSFLFVFSPLSHPSPSSLTLLAPLSFFVSSTIRGPAHKLPSSLHLQGWSAVHTQSFWPLVGDGLEQKEGGGGVGSRGCTLAQLVLSFQVRAPHPRGTCRKEANGHPTLLVGTSSQEKAAFQQSCVLRTHKYFAPLLLCIPHTSTSSPLECQTVFPLLLLIHLSSLFSRVQAIPLPLRRLAPNPHWQGGGTLYSVSQFWGHDLRLLLGQNRSPLSASCYLPQP